MAQFQACLHDAGDAWGALGTCGYAAGYAYGANAALQTVYAWQFVAGVGWAVAGVLWCVLAWLVLRLGRRGR